MKIKRILVSIILIFGIMFTAPAASAATPEDLASEMLSYYYNYRGSGLADIERLLQKMEAIDADEAAQWRVLMESWHQANTQIDFTNDTLPDGLPDDDSLCIVVMGYQLGSGGTMQDELLNRLNIALAAAKQYPNAYILVTGGATGSGSNATEASRMASWLMYQNILPERIIQEGNSYSTEDNAINSLKILKSEYPQVKHLALVTSDYHMLRTHLVFAGRQAAVGGDIIDIVGHACYDTPTGTGMSYAHQAELLGIMTGVSFDKNNTPTLSTVTELTLSGSPTLEQGDPLGITATAEYDTGFFRDVTALTEFAGYDPTKLGTQNLSASFTENGVTVTAIISVEVVPAQTANETEADAPISGQAVHEESSQDAEAEPEKDPTFKWLIGIAVVLLIALLIIVYELRQQYLRIQRRKRRKRKRLNLE